MVLKGERAFEWNGVVGNFKLSQRRVHFRQVRVDDFPPVYNNLHAIMIERNVVGVPFASWEGHVEHRRNDIVNRSGCVSGRGMSVVVLNLNLKSPVDRVIGLLTQKDTAVSCLLYTSDAADE